MFPSHDPIGIRRRRIRRIAQRANEQLANEQLTNEALPNRNPLVTIRSPSKESENPRGPGAGYTSESEIKRRREAVEESTTTPKSPTFQSLRL